MMNNSVHWYDRDYEYEIKYNCTSQDISQEFTIPYDDSIEFAKLSMEIVAGKFLLIDDTASLVDFEKRGSLIDYKYAVTQTDNLVDIDIFIEDDMVLRTHSKNKIAVSLNPQPIWDLGFEVGAADVEFDFSGLKISDLNVEGGAAAIIITLGDAFNNTKVNIETGASSVKVKVPEKSGCDLQIKSVMSGKSINGFEKVDHGHYRTDNFDQAENKVYLVIETAVSSCSIIRY